VEDKVRSIKDALGRLFRTTALIVVAEIAIGGAAAIANPEGASKTLVWLGQEALGRGDDGMVSLFLLLAALGLAVGLTLAVAFGIFELLRRQAD
jgi:hypothetical protein